MRRAKRFVKVMHLIKVNRSNHMIPSTSTIWINPSAKVRPQKKQVNGMTESTIIEKKLQSMDLSVKNKVYGGQTRRRKEESRVSLVVREYYIKWFETGPRQITNIDRLLFHEDPITRDGGLSSTRFRTLHWVDKSGDISCSCLVP